MSTSPTRRVSGKERLAPRMFGKHDVSLASQHVDDLGLLLLRRFISERRWDPLKELRPQPDVLPTQQRCVTPFRLARPALGLACSPKALGHSLVTGEVLGDALLNCFAGLAYIEAAPPRSGLPLDGGLHPGRADFDDVHASLGWHRLGCAWRRTKVVRA